MIDAQTTVITPEAFLDHAKVVTDSLTRMSGFLHRSLTLKQAGRMEFRRPIRLEIKPSEHAGSYRMEITPNGITIAGSDPEGLMHGVQTFNQMMPSPEKPMQRMELPCQTISDWPESGRRIFTVDTSAHMFSTPQLKEFVDWLAFHKLNELHLFLNGDAGWRMESVEFPKLHQVGSVRASTPPYGDPTGSDGTQYGGYYTQDNLRDLVAHGKSRGVKIIPGFHFSTGASAIIASYPRLGTTPAKVEVTWQDREVSLSPGEASGEFIKGLLEEVTAIFPDGVRVEGDDVKWVTGLAPKIPLVGGGSTQTDFSVYGLPAAAELLTDRAREARPGLNTVKNVYSLAAGESMEATLKTELVHDYEKFQYQVFPRIAAFAEAAWLPAEEKKYEDFRTRLTDMMGRYRRAKVNASETYEVYDRIALHGTEVTTTMEFLDNRWPELAFDGEKKTSFRVNSAKKGDVLTFKFPCELEGDVTVATGGENGDLPSILADGVLEVSADGEEWEPLTEFLNGLAAVTIPEGMSFLRIRVTYDQDHALILHELELSRPLLVPDLVDTRNVPLVRFEKGKPVNYELPITFVVNFEKHPERRDEIAAMREFYFKQWVQVTNSLGLVGDARVPDRIEIDPSEFGELSDADAEDYLLTKMFSEIQQYRDDAPPWFVSGMLALIRHKLVPESTWSKSFPGKADLENPLAGGVQTAAFLEWAAMKYSPALVQSISQDCSYGGYREETWEVFANQPLQDVLTEYRTQKN